MRKLVRIGSNVRIPEDSHCEDKGYCSYFSKKIEMVKIAIPNFCINFLNKTVKSLSILCDFAVASLVGAWIKICSEIIGSCRPSVASLVGAWIKIVCRCTVRSGRKSHPSRMRGLKYLLNTTNKSTFSRILCGCVD